MYIIKSVSQVRYSAQNLILLAISFHCQTELLVLLFLLCERDKIKKTANSALSSLLL